MRKTNPFWASRSIRGASGILPGNLHRAAGRFELRGGVAEFVEAAARHLAPEGRTVILMDGLEQSRARAMNALAASGLFPRTVIAVHPRPDRNPIYRIFEARRTAGASVLKLTVEGQSARQSRALANSAARTLLGTAGQLYDLRREAEFRLVSGPTTAVKVAGWPLLILLSFVLGTISTLIILSVGYAASRRLKFSLFSHNVFE